MNLAIRKINQAKTACNFDEFHDLIEVYEKMSLTKINRVWNEKSYKMTAKKAARLLTGFGSIKTCKLCAKVREKTVYKSDSVTGMDCSQCLWYQATGYTCSDGTNEKSYQRIMQSASPESLLTAYFLRASHMKKAMKNV